MTDDQWLDLDALEAVAQAANPDHGRPWEWSAHGAGGYPQQVIRQGDAALIAELYEGPDHPSTLAEFIAAFDPPTVLALIEQARAGERIREGVLAIAGHPDDLQEWESDDGTVRKVPVVDVKRLIALLDNDTKETDR